MLEEDKQMNNEGLLTEGESLPEIERVLEERTKADLSLLSPQEQYEILMDKVAVHHELPVVPTSERLAEQLKESVELRTPLTIKFGIDPTGSDIHLGHMISLMMADRFLRMGHKVTMVVGDFTAKIGDGSGRDSARKPLTDDQIADNLQTYKEQAKRVIDVDKIDYRFNSEWLGKLSPAQIISVAQKISAGKMWQREDFQKRLQKGSYVSMAELMYPIFMGMDSVQLKPDIEIGGLDQYLNLLWCRELMTIYNQKPETFLTVDLIPGTDGRKDSDNRILKMSKSLGNYIAINSSPNDMYGKVMSIPDDIMWIWLRELTELHTREIDQLKIRSSLNETDSKFVHPMQLKKMLARLVVGRFNGWNHEVITKAEETFNGSTGKANLEGVPSEAEVKKLLLSEESLWGNIAVSIDKSKSEIKRLLDQGAVYILIENQFVKLPNDLFEAEAQIRQAVVSNPQKQAYVKVGKRGYINISDKIGSENANNS